MSASINDDGDPVGWSHRGRCHRQPRHRGYRRDGVHSALLTLYLMAILMVVGGTGTDMNPRPGTLWR
jgi:hypothetical protein